ncbi:unnamed protein product [Lymnaea stagnalis]|uniref:Bifunctional apoptosis regulator n=1 Tax=Lymnaea stagnalis TaxID=6523 RepID=A0AAV2H0B4_LYMST
MNPSDDTTERNRTELIHRNITGISNDLEEEFACSVCLRLAVQPTTLTCGHTSCRICLAKWYFNSKKKECPMCRQTYMGHPKVNFQLRNLVRKLMPQEITNREKELEAETEDQNLLKKFEKQLAESNIGQTKKNTDIFIFCAGIIIALCVSVVVYLAWYWQSSDSNLLVMKPVQTWRQKDVATWLEEMGWASHYASLALENKIDGNMLLSLTNDSLTHFLNVTDITHERALLFAINMLKEHGVKMPATLWEYKALYPGRCLFLVYGMKDFPRTSLLYLWMYFYDDMFLPFVKTTTKTTVDIIPVSNSSTDVISKAEWVSFMIFAVLLPEWLVVVFTWQMFSHHFFSPMFVLATAVLYQVMEILTWIKFFNNMEWRLTIGFIKAWIRHLMSAFIFMVVWPLVPNLICDIFFYGALYISPVQALIAVYKKFIAINNAM